MTDNTAPVLPAEASEWLELMSRDEPLHPDLQRYVFDGPLGPTLKHPLVYATTLHAPALLNRQFAAKTDASAQAFHEARWMSYIWLHERPWRLEAFKRVMDKLDDREYWEHLRDVWVDSENAWQNLEDWLDLFQSDRPGRRYFMLAEERKLFRQLPDVVTVYRGCFHDLNDDSPSWTRDRERALWFARRCVRLSSLEQFDGLDAVVLVAEVPKSAILGYIPLARGEDEVIVRDLEEVRVTRMEEVECPE